MQAGSEYGYKLLFVVLLAGLFAIYMQVRTGRGGGRLRLLRASRG